MLPPAARKSHGGLEQKGYSLNKRRTYVKSLESAEARASIMWGIGTDRGSILMADAVRHTMRADE